jgi:hypothetical protein
MLEVKQRVRRLTMKVRDGVVGALVLGFCVLSPAVGRAQEPETPGQVLQFQTNVGTGHNCGHVSTPLNCYGIPVNIGPSSGGNGTLWLDTYVTGYNTGKGFVLFNGVADLGQGTVTSNSVVTTNSAGQITTLKVVFNGSTNDGDGGTYTGTMTLTFSYYYSGVGSGKGGGGAGWHFMCTGGSVQITYK